MQLALLLCVNKVSGFNLGKVGLAEICREKTILSHRPESLISK